MPCWFFDRKEIRSSPSSLDNIDQSTENRYRREGARLILDSGSKLGLRYDTCATGVVYFHRFFMFHSFRSFHRYPMAACCLFLAGKVEETPKKCRDIIRTVQTLLNPEAYAAFGDDPREEVMTMERILLQTIKFDLQVEHPYGWLLSYCKQIKGDKDKIQKMAQMSWTFINDSLCTTLSLQWESEIIAVSLMYLASRLTKFDPTDWTGRVPGSKSRWWEDLIEGMSMELMEDICHQVLDLYSAQQQAAAQKQGEVREISPPVIAGPRAAAHVAAGPRDTPPPPPKDPPPPSRKHKLESPADALGGSNKGKKGKREREDTPSKPQPVAAVVAAAAAAESVPPPPSSSTTSSSSTSTSRTASPNLKTGGHVSVAAAAAAGGTTGSRVSSSSAPVNPYVASSMYTSSFMSQEGQQSIQSLLGGGAPNAKHPPPPPPQPYPSYPPPPAATPGQQYPPPPAAAGPYPPPSGGYGSGGGGGGAVYPAPGQYGAQPPYTGSYTAPPYGQGLSSSSSSSTSQTNTTTPSSYPPPSAPYGQGYPPYSNPAYPPSLSQPPPAGPPPPFPPPGFGAPPPSTYNTPPPPIMPHRGGRPNQSNLAPVRHVSDRGGMR